MSATRNTRVRRDLHEANRHSWNEATRAHNSHKGDQARFLREGGSTLFPEEIELLGDIAGRSLVHLQCNAGQDTLSLARLGAAVTGIDISDAAIEFARRLSSDSGISATFHRADVYDWLDEMAGGSRRFDIAFASYGALIWLSDIHAWARGVAGVLAPGGRLALVEFHPFWYIFDDDWTPKFSYFARGEPQTFAEGIGDYVGLAGASLVPWGYEEGVTDFRNPYPSHEFPWGLGEVVTALLDAGLTLESLREYPYANGAKLCSGMRELPGRRMAPPEGVPDIPLMYSLVARKAPEQ